MKKAGAVAALACAGCTSVLHAMFPSVQLPPEPPPPTCAEECAEGYYECVGRVQKGYTSDAIASAFARKDIGRDRSGDQQVCFDGWHVCKDLCADVRPPPSPAPR